MRYKRPDNKNALSMIQAAKRDIKFTLTILPTQDSGPTIIRNIYESFRMIGDGILVSKGIKSKDHITPIKELTKLQVKTNRPIILVENLRRLRHNINYYGYNPKLEEVKEAISLIENIFDPLSDSVKENLLKIKPIQK